MVDRIYKGSVGVLVTIRTGANLTGATVIIQVRKQRQCFNDEFATWAPTIADPPTDGILKYTTKTGDLDLAGDYTIQPVITLPGGIIGKCNACLWRIYDDYAS